MIVLSTNPIIRDILDQSFLMAQDYFFVDYSSTFKESMALAFIDNRIFTKEANFIRFGVKYACRNNGIKPPMSRVVDEFISNENIEMILISDGGKVILVAFKIKGVAVNLENKKILADIKRVIANILVLFVKTGVIEKLPENVVDVVNQIYEKVTAMLVTIGSVKRVSRDWSIDE